MPAAPRVVPASAVPGLRGPPPHQEIGSALAFEFSQLLAMDFAHPRGCDGFGSVDLFDPQAGLILVEVLTGHAGAIVVAPNERLAAVRVIEPVRRSNS
jgi:hypothetical protein